FGYQTPQQQARASLDEGVEEASEATFIEAESAEQALAWGREISEEFVRRLFGSRVVDWKSNNFVHWVEAEPQSEYPEDILQSLPVVAYGQHPDFKSLREQHT